MRAPAYMLIMVVISAAAPAESPRDHEDSVAARLAAAEDRSGEVVWLQSGGREYFALFEEAIGPRDAAAAVIMHGMGGHADWPDVVAPLRTGLPARGWATLSIQLPVLPPEASWDQYRYVLKEAPARVAGAMNFLAQRGYRRIVLAGYGFGAALAANYLATRESTAAGFAAVSMQVPPFLERDLPLLSRLERVEVPVLDIYGGRDGRAVLEDADDRRLAGRQRDAGYTQVVIEDADHSFVGYESALVEKLGEWLKQAVPRENRGEN